MARAHPRQGFQYDAFLARLSLANPAERVHARHEVAFLEAALELPRGRHLLDLPCGTGRHAALLGRKGYRVTAVDASQGCIDIARAENAHRNVRYERLDVRRVGRLGERFDGVVSLFSFVGCLPTDVENQRALECLVEPLAPGGRFVLSTANGAWVAREAERRSLFELAGHAVVRVDRYDRGTRRLTTRVWALDAADVWRRFQLRRRLYAKDELIAGLRRAGVHGVRCYGGFDGSPFRSDRSPHVIYVGRKR